MKKFLLSIFAVLFAFAGVYAEEVTGNALETYGTSNISITEFKVDPVTLTFAKANGTTAPAYNKAGDCRIYAKGTITATCSTGTLTRIVFTVSAQGLKRLTDLTPSTGTVTIADDHSTITWEGNASEIVMTVGSSAVYGTDGSSKAGQICFTEFTATYTTSGDTPVLPTAEKPVFNLESQEFNLGESVTVEISAAEGATIYYTTDGKNPTEESDVYENALTITETTTVKAIAVMDGYNNSAVAEATYTAVDPNAKTATFDFTNPAGLTPSVTEFTSSAYNTSNTTFTNGGVTLKTTDGGTASRIWKGSSAYDFRIYTGGSITIAAPAGGVLTSIEFTGNTVTPTPNVGNFSDKIWTGDAPSVVFTVSENQKINTITVTYSIDESVVIIDQPSIAGEATFVGSTTVEITNNAEGTTLYYSTNGEDYVAYNGAFNISETTTVYAKAVDAQGNESAIAKATFTKLETLSIAEAKAAYDTAGDDVDVAMDLTGAVVTVNSGQYMFIENKTTGINIYSSGADYAEGTKFTSGYILGTSTTYRNMHQIKDATFHGVTTTEVTVEPLEVTIADIAGNYEEYEGRFVKLEGVSIASDLTMTQDDNDYKAYDRFALGFGAIANCDVTGVVAIYNTGEQLYIKDITYTLSVSAAKYATLFLDFNAAIPAEVEAYTVTEINNGYVTLTKVEGVLPAETGIIVKAEAGDYELAYSTENVADVTGNKLLGTTVDTDIDVEAYVLSAPDGIESVGLYKAAMTDGTWLNNAFKAYLPASAVPAAVQGAASFSFRFGEGTTGIEKVEIRNEKSEIYDLTGRRVENPSNGIYIINGVKTLVK